jgi:hypothetical protein
MTDNLSVSPHDDNTTTVYGLYVTDTDATAPDDTFTMHASTFHAPGSSVDPHEDTGLLLHINDTLSDGVTYNPGSPQPDTDMVTFTVSDTHGHSDLVNFIFLQGGSGSPVTLTGTAEKDVIFATGEDDILTGGAKSDQFVFQQQDGPSHDQITDFVHGVDKIDFMFASSPFTQGDEYEFQAWAADHIEQTPAGTVINLDNGGTIQLNGIDKTDLRATDFYTHSGI